MICSIYKFNENNIIVYQELYTNNWLKDNQYLSISETDQYSFYYNKINIHFVYRASSTNYCCLWSSKFYSSSVDFYDFKILIQNDKVLILYHKNRIVRSNIYFNYNFNEGQYYELEIILDKIDDEVKCFINGIQINSNYYNTFISKTFILFKPSLLYHSQGIVLRESDTYFSFIGDGYNYEQFNFYYNDYNPIHPEFDSINRNIGNCSICYVSCESLSEYNTYIKMFEVLLKNNPPYTSKTLVYNLNLTINSNPNFNNDLDNTWFHLSNQQPICCSNCNYKKQLIFDNLLASDRTIIYSIGLSNTENINIYNNDRLSCIFDSLEQFIFLLVQSINNYKNYFLEIETIDGCYKFYLRVNSCDNYLLNIHALNLQFDLEYQDLDCCIRRIEIEEGNIYDCCLSFYVNKNLLYLHKNYYLNIIDDIKNLYNSKLNVSNDIIKKLFFINKINSIYYIKKLELERCLDIFDFKKYLEDINCYIKDKDLKCLIENIDDMKECCNDNEFDILCKCRDEVPTFKEYEYDIDIQSYPLGGYNLSSIVNEGILNYKCCEEDNITVQIDNNNLTHLNIVYVFNNTTFQFTQFNLVNSGIPFDKLPKKEYFDIIFTYCNKHIVKKRIYINYIQNCEHTLPNDTYYFVNVQNVNLNSQTAIIGNVNIDFSFGCCGDIFNAISFSTFNGYKILTNSNVIKIININFNPITQQLNITYNILPYNIPSSKLIKTDRCSYIYEEEIEFIVTICNNVNINNVIKFKIDLYTEETDNISIDVNNFFSNNNIPYIGSQTLYSVLIKLCNKKCCNDLCLTSISSNDINESLGQINIVYFNPTETYNTNTLSSYYKTLTYTEDCECGTLMGIHVNFQRNPSTLELVGYPNLPSGSKLPLFLKVNIKGCGIERQEYIHIFTIIY